MSVYKGTTLLAGVATNTKYNANNLLDWKWTDHELNDQSWLRADTFSWQPATTQNGTYLEAYNHLVADYNGGTSQTETVGSYTITYVLATDGHKITTDETNVTNIYNESGAAWYYVLDTTNQRFKLPRTKYGFVGLRDTVGKYVPESLPSFEIVSKTSQPLQGGTAPAGTKLTGVSGNYGIRTESTAYGDSNPAGMVLQASSLTAGTTFCPDNSTYQDNAPVQQRATQMYLYFYVGQFSQSATEQTAGLNTELFNGKADIDLSNANKYNLIRYAFENIQNTDSTKVGYIYYANGTNINVFAPVGGKWLVLSTYEVNDSTGVVYIFAADILKVPGEIVDGGTKVSNARSGYRNIVSLLKIQ